MKMLNSTTRNGRLKTAEEFFQHLLISGYHLSVRTYSIMINGLYKEGLLDEAMALLSKMKGNACLPNTLTYETIIRALLCKSENEKAEKLLHEMVSRGLLKGGNMDSKSTIPWEVEQILDKEFCSSKRSKGHN